MKRKSKGFALFLCLALVVGVFPGMTALAATPSVSLSVNKNASNNPNIGPFGDGITPLGTGGGGAMYNPNVSPVDPEIVLMQCDMSINYMTWDGGKTWKVLPFGSSRIQSVAFDPVDRNVIYVASGSTWKTTDCGATWTSVWSTQPAAMAVDPDNRNIVYCLTGSGTSNALWITENAFATAPVSRLSNAISGVQNLGYARVPVMFVDPASPVGARDIYAIGANPVANVTAGAARISGDGAGNWSRTGSLTYPNRTLFLSYFGENPANVPAGSRFADYAYNPATGNTYFYVVTNNFDPRGDDPHMANAVYRVPKEDLFDFSKYEKITDDAMWQECRDDENADEGHYPQNNGWPDDPDRPVYGYEHSMWISNIGAAYDTSTGDDILYYSVCFLWDEWDVPNIDIGYYGVVKGVGPSARAGGESGGAAGGVDWAWSYRTWDIDNDYVPNKLITGNFDVGWIEFFWGSGWTASPWGFVVCKTDPNYVYSTHMGGGSCTYNGGELWQSTYCDTPLDYRADPNYAHTANQERYFISTSGLNITTVHGLFPDPHNPEHIIMANTDIGLMNSWNGGASWSPIISGLIEDGGDGIPSNMTMTCYWALFDPDVPGKVWACFTQNHDIPETKVFPAYDGENRGHTTSPNKNPGAVCYSEDGGVTWRLGTGTPDKDIFTRLDTTLTQNPTTPMHIVLDPGSPPNNRTLYAAVWGQGVYKSTDDGKTWKLANGPGWTSFDTIPSGPNTYADSINRPRAYFASKMDLFAFRLMFAPDGALYCSIARTGGQAGNYAGQLYKSVDGAETWSLCPAPTGGTLFITGMDYDPRVNDDGSYRIYAAVNAGTTQGLYWSEDQGESWERFNTSSLNGAFGVSVDPFNPSVLYVARRTGGLWKSIDRGGTWAQISLPFNNLFEVVPDIYNSSNVYMCSFGGSAWYVNALTTGETNAVKLADGSPGIAGDAKITGLPVNGSYKVEVSYSANGYSEGPHMFYTGADGMLSLERGSFAPLGDGQLYGLINNKTYNLIKLDKATATAKDFISIKETSKNSRVWILSFNVTETYANGDVEVVSYAIALNANNANVDGKYNLGPYTLIYDIKGNGSNIKEFRILLP